MTAGIKILHELDKAITRARKAVGEATDLSAKASDAVAQIQRERAGALGQIADDRLDLIGDGRGGDLGYVDRQAEKLLKAHAAELSKMTAQTAKGEAKITKLEAERRKQEALAAKAVDAYDRQAAMAEAKLIIDPDYQAQLEQVAALESTVVRAEEKLELAQEDEAEKGKPYREDRHFSYLAERGYGTKNHKGWFLTHLLDGWIARRSGYRKAAENYRRLTAIPARLANHVEDLEVRVLKAQAALQKLEADWLTKQGVTARREASLAAQKKLDAIDAKINAAEAAHEALLADQAALIRGETGPYKEASALLADTFSRQTKTTLRRIAAQTQTPEDDAAVARLDALSEAEMDLTKDRREAEKLLSSYQRTLRDLSDVRQNFKGRRYDAPSSSFKRADAIRSVIKAVLSGRRTGKDLWKQITRNQRTNKRYSDSDFGGIDWNEGLRLPRNSGGWGGNFPLPMPAPRRRRRNSGVRWEDILGGMGGGNRGGVFGGTGGWGGSGRSPRRRSRIPRTRIPRMPRTSLPKLPRGGGGGGGFRTGGGF